MFNRSRDLSNVRTIEVEGLRFKMFPDFLVIVFLRAPDHSYSQVYPQT